MKLKFPAFVLAVVAFALIGGGVALAHGPRSTGFSGYEFFPGVACDADGDTDVDDRCGVSFAGWTNAGDDWVPYPGNGGRWAASVHYTSSAGIGEGPAVIVGGFWSWKRHNGITHGGPVTGGEITWPSSHQEDIGCGAGVAVAEVSILDVPLATGSIEGCLDDTHLPGQVPPEEVVFPPKIWGTLTLSTPH